MIEFDWKFKIAPLSSDCSPFWLILQISKLLSLAVHRRKSSPFLWSVFHVCGADLAPLSSVFSGEGYILLLLRNLQQLEHLFPFISFHIKSKPFCKLKKSDDGACWGSGCSRHMGCRGSKSEFWVCLGWAWWWNFWLGDELEHESLGRG